MKRPLPIILMLALAMILATGTGASADDVKVSLDVDKGVLTLKDSLTVVITVSSKGIKSVPSADLADPSILESYRTAHGQNVSFINGKVSVEKTTRIVYIPIKTGTAVIGPATVNIKGKVYKSNTIKVRVVDSKANIPPPPTEDSETTAPAGNVFLKVVAAPEKIYLGAQVTVSLYLYTNSQLSGLNFTQFPDFKDFWSEELLTPRNPDFQNTTLNGKPYRVALIRRYALFPLKTGKVVIEPFGMEAQVIEKRKGRGRSSWPFVNDNFVDQVELFSPKVELDVLPLPKTNRPDGFKDIVGNFDLEVILDKDIIKAGDPVTLSLVVSGKGNFKTLASPNAHIPEGINTYSETSELDIQPSSEMVGGTKIFSMILVPRQEGEFDIGPVVLDFYDPDAMSYQRISKGPFKINVLKSDQATTPQSLIINQKEVKLSGSDIRYIRADAKTLTEITKPYYLHPLFLVLLGIWPPGLLIIFVVMRFRVAAMSDEKRLRYRRAGRMARTKIKNAKSYIKTDVDEFYAELTEAILGFVADKTGASCSGIVVNHLIDDFIGAQAAPELVKELSALFLEADSVRYGGQTSDILQRRIAAKKAKALLGMLDKGNLLEKLS